MLEMLAQSPALFISVAAVLGLVVGSFLNVVALRVPAMLEREWRDQCRELLGAAPGEAGDEPPLNLVRPASRCPHCGHAIRAWENIPVLSWLWLRGRCSACGSAIGVRYPVVEAATGVLSGVVAWHFGWGWEAAAALVFTWFLIPLTVIDLDHQLLPDNMTLPLLWLGLALALVPVFAELRPAVLGAVLGYLALWSVYWLFKLITGKEGMGHGDFKLLAALGAWMGWQALPLVVVLSSVVGAVVGVTLLLVRGRDRNIPIPFGPYLAAAGWIALLWGEDLTAAYFRFAGLAP